MLGPEGQPLKRDYYSQETGKDLESSETTRGFETSAGKYITVIRRTCDGHQAEGALAVCPREELGFALEYRS